jgi:hypothetical protein
MELGKKLASIKVNRILMPRSAATVRAAEIALFHISLGIKFHCSSILTMQDSIFAARS